MTAPRLDATALAARMNARPLPEGTDGGVWEAAYSAAGNEAECDACGFLIHGDCTVSNALVTLCLPCALADCERAEQAPRTTANEGDEQDAICRACGDHTPCDCGD